MKTRYYPTNHRITHIKRLNSTREEVVQAFSNAWREGREFKIILKEDGSMVVKDGTKKVAFYRDAEAFAKDFIPEALE